jgi:hypothetical protein
MIDKKTCEVYSRLIKRKLHHRLWRLPYAEVLVCHKQRVEVIPSNLSIERSWVPFRCWVSLFLMGFTSNTNELDESLPNVAVSLLQEYEDVFPNDVPSGL